MKGTMLELNSITKYFSRNTVNEKIAVSGLSLSVPTGQFVTIIGSNGAGKSTLLNLVAGVYPVDEGSVFFDGADVTKLVEHKRASYVGRIFQNPMMGTASSMTIEENLVLAEERGKKRTLRWGVTNSRRRRYREMLSMLGLGLENRLKESVRFLSGGQRQSLALIMAVLNPPRLLLLDEHTAALDPKTAGVVMEHTGRLVREFNLTTLMVTHNLNLAIDFGHRLIMMHEGNIRFQVEGSEKKDLTVNDVISRFGVTQDKSLFGAG